MFKKKQKEVVPDEPLESLFKLIVYPILGRAMLIGAIAGVVVAGGIVAIVLVV